MASFLSKKGVALVQFACELNLDGVQFNEVKTCKLFIFTSGTKMSCNLSVEKHFSETLLMKVAHGFAYKL